MARSPQLTVIATGPAVGLPSLVLTRLALLLYVAQLAEVVAAVTWTTRLWPGASVIGWPARLSTWLPGPPVRLKLAGLPVVPSMTQVTGVAALPPGRLSASSTPVALPWPVLLIVSV